MCCCHPLRFVCRTLCWLACLAGLVFLGLFLAELATPARAEAPSADVRSGSLTTSDGVPLVYEVRGEATADVPTLVFVHCWACDRSVWRHQVDEFASDHRVVTLDLAGHGASGAGRDSWTLDSLAADVAFVVETLGLGEVILVGHSMGGPVAVLAAPRIAERVRGIVCVDTLHDLHQEFPAEQAEALIAAFEEDFEAAVGQMTRGTLPEDVDPAIPQSVIEKAVAADRDAVLGLMRDFAALDLAAAAAEVEVPMRCVQAGLVQRQFHAEDMSAANRRIADWDAEVIDGVGHFLLLEEPATVNRALRAAVEEIEGGEG